MRNFLLFVLAAALSAQNPVTPVYPGSIATDQILSVEKNNVTSTLSGGINAVTTSIPVAFGTGSRFRVGQIITLGYTALGEKMIITAIAGDTLTVASRGAYGSTAATAIAGTMVSQFHEAVSHNAVAAEVKAIETALGPGLANVAGVAPPKFTFTSQATPLVMVHNLGTRDIFWNCRDSSGVYYGTGAGTATDTNTLSIAINGTFSGTCTVTAGGMGLAGPVGPANGWTRVGNVLQPLNPGDSVAVGTTVQARYVQSDDAGGANPGAQIVMAPSTDQGYLMSNWFYGCGPGGCISDPANDRYARNGGSSLIIMGINSTAENAPGDMLFLTAPAGTAGTHVPWTTNLWLKQSGGGHLSGPLTFGEMGLAPTYRGGITSEATGQMIDFGMNDSSLNRFGGTYTSAVQGGMFRIAPLAGLPLFSWLGRPAGVTGAVTMLRGLDSAGHWTANAANNDYSGTITLTAEAVHVHTFATAYTAAPVCTVTPTADPGVSLRWWVAPSTTQVAVVVSSATTLTFTYVCVGNPN